MIWLAKWITAVLAASFGTVAYGQSNSCLADPSSKCISDTTIVNLASCGITDLDIADINTCLDTIGRSTITTLRLDGNELTTLPAGLLDNLGSLQELYLGSNQIGTIEADTFKDLASLDYLYLDNNQIGTIEAVAFKGLASLSILSLTDNQIGTLEADAFTDLASLRILYLSNNELITIPGGAFDNLSSLRELRLNENKIGTIAADAFKDFESLLELNLENNELSSIQAGWFDNMIIIQRLYMNDNHIGTIEADAFKGLASLSIFLLNSNDLTSVQAGVFDGMASLLSLYMYDNKIATIEADAFKGLASLQELRLDENALTTLPAGIFEDLGSGSSLMSLDLSDNPDLQCVPTVTSRFVSAPTTVNMCGCTPAAAVTCDMETESCVPGNVGYTCATVDTACSNDNECDTGNGEVCCPLTKLCENPDDVDAGACGDPHMTGFRGQKFDFVGKDDAWYALVSDLPYMHLNMRVTTPVLSVPEITYITGISIVTTDADGHAHGIVIFVSDPHSLDSSCPVGIYPCLADGALTVVVDGEEVMLAPGEITLAPEVAIAAVNLPGPCRSFGFEKYWSRKKLEMLAQPGRRLKLSNTMQDMSSWILADPPATNMVECAEYVANAKEVGEVGLFVHESEHVSFQIMTPTTKIRLSHGRLHQLPMRDPTDQFDLPDHLSWQMNIAIDHTDMSPEATGILGETLVPTLDENGSRIMQGMGAIRGEQEDYRVEGPLGVIFAQGQHDD